LTASTLQFRTLASTLRRRTNGELLRLGLEGCACLTKSMDAEGEERRRLLERCLELRLREREGWLAVRTPEHYVFIILLNKRLQVYRPQIQHKSASWYHHHHAA
jgi:hypothetical protein